MSALDDISDWLGSGPGAPFFAQMLAEGNLVVKDFGAPEGNGVFDGLRVEISPPPQNLLAPTNGLLWQVPDLSALGADKQKRCREHWPLLRRIDGTPWLSDPLPGQLQPNDLLFEVWPAAFRRIESLFAALDFPIPGEDLEKHASQMPDRQQRGPARRLDLRQRLRRIQQPREVVQLTLDGVHTRIGLQPHGTAGGALWAGFRERSCFRVRVVDNARWLPLNDNDLNEFARYTEGNEYLPLIDGRSAYRALYRALRATYVQESYDDEDHVPDGTPRPSASAQQSRILAINCWISPANPLLGQRGMLTTARTQPGAAPPDDLPCRFAFIPSVRFDD